MSGRISVDDRAFDGAARSLTSARSGLSGVKGQLSDGLAAGAPGAVGGEVRGALANARKVIGAVDGNLERRADEMRRRAALTRIANGDGKASDLGLLLKYGASRLARGFGTKVAGPVELKDLFGGAEASLSKWATHWSTHVYRRNPGFGSGPNEISRRRAYLTQRGHWADYKRDILKNQSMVEKLRKGAKRLWFTSLAADVLEVATAKTGAERSEKLGGVGGGYAAGRWLAKPFNKHVGKAITKGAAKFVVTSMGKRMIATRTGAAVGAMVGGPVGAAVGAGVGFVVVSVASSNAGKWVGRQVSGAATAAVNAAKEKAEGLVKKVKFW